MKRMLLTGLLILASLLSLQVQTKALPEALTSAIILKLLSLEAGLQAREKIRIWVINDPALAKKLQQRLGKRIGRSTLAAVYTDTLPADAKPDLVYINNTHELKRYLSRANSFGAISVSPNPEAVNQGVTVVVYDDQGLPAITINMPPSRKLKLQWDPSVLEISDVIY